MTQYFEDSDRVLTKNGLQYMSDDGKEGASKYAFSRDEADMSRQQTIALPIATQMDRSKTAPPSATVAGTPSTSMDQSYDSSTSNSSLAASSSSSALAASSSTIATCPVCYDDYPIDATVALGCGHRSVEWQSANARARLVLHRTHVFAALFLRRLQLLSKLLGHLSHYCRQ